jgi:uncharacterized protein YwgA
MTTKAQDVWNKVAVLTMCDEMHKMRSTIDNIHIQKFCFLSELKGREQNLKTAYYRFFRYNNGPYCPALANDVTTLIKGGFVDPESWQILERGKYLYAYIKDDIEESRLAVEAVGVIRETVGTWHKFKGWDIVEEVYKMIVPVDSLGRTMLVKDIPMKTDILIPERTTARDVSPFSVSLIEEIAEEIKTAEVSFDPNSSEFRHSVTQRLNSALALN